MRIIRRIIFQLLCLLGACCYIPATAQVVLVDIQDYSIRK